MKDILKTKTRERILMIIRWNPFKDKKDEIL